MIKLEQCTKTYGDLTAGYEVTLDKQYTVKEFINEVLTRKEWGYIGILKEKPKSIFGDPNCEYKYDKLISSLSEDYLNKKISKVSADGGYSRMDYLISVI